jgi:hypothetical protein
MTADQARWRYYTYLVATRASDTNDVGDDVELEDLSSSSGLPKRFAASGVIDIQAAAGLERPDIALPHSHTVALLHRDSVTYREVFNPRRSLVPWLTTFRSTWTSSSQPCAGRGYNTTWEISPRGPSHLMTEGNRVQPSC